MNIITRKLNGLKHQFNCLLKIKKVNKTIGIVANYKLLKNDKVAMGIDNDYVDYFSKFGKVITICPSSTQIENIDLLVLPGGRDVNPLRYNEFPRPTTQAPDHAFEYFDTFVLPKYIESKIPIFGICRGAQSLYVTLGGKLTQDFNFNYSKHGADKVDDLLMNPFQPIEINSSNQWWITNESSISKNNKIYYNVNSYHHQHCGVRRVTDFSSELDGVIVLAKHKTFHSIEAWMHESLPIIGVQWHPERMGRDIYSDSLIKKLLNQ